RHGGGRCPAPPTGPRSPHHKADRIHGDPFPHRHHRPDPRPEVHGRPRPCRAGQRGGGHQRGDRPGGRGHHFLCTGQGCRHVQHHPRGGPPGGGHHHWSGDGQDRKSVV